MFEYEEILSRLPQRGSLEEDFRTKYLLSLARPHETILEEVAGRERSLALPLIEQRLLQAVPADILAYLLNLPLEQRRELIQRALRHSLHTPIETQAGLDRVFLYSQAVLQDGDITPLPLESHKQGVQIDQIQAEIAQAIAQLKTIPEDMKARLIKDPSYLPFVMRVVRHCKQIEAGATDTPLTVTQIWKHALVNPRGIDNEPLWVYDQDSVYLTTIPPVKPGEVAKGEHTLYVGTNAELSDLRKVGEKFLTPEQQERMRYVSQASSLWPAFFGHNNFLDETERSLPSRIVMTGLIRGYNHSGGYTAPVGELLTAAAEIYGINLEQITSFAP